MTASGQHAVKVGESVTELIDGHAARADSPEFIHARTVTHRIVATLDPNPYGPGPVECHHGGSIWLYDAKTPTWRIVTNWAGCEWSAQFAADPAKIEALRQNAEAVTAAFPATLPALDALGYPDNDILSMPITDAAGVGRYVDSIWNSCLPIPKAGHTGRVTAATPTAAGAHNYPASMVDLLRFMRPDFVPFLVDAKTAKVAVVAPVAPRGSGDGRVRVLYAEPGHPLAKKRAEAVAAGEALVLAVDHPLATQAFAQQT